MDQARFLSLLEDALRSDTPTVKEATAALKKDFYPHADSLTTLLRILTQHENPQLRQLAATQARSLVPKHWRKNIPDNLKTEIRKHLLKATLEEQNSLVRHNEARVVAAIAKVDAEDNEWEDLPPLMAQAASSSAVQEREVATYILYTILESMGDGFQTHFADLFTLFSKTINDPDSEEVQMNTMLALSKMAMLLDGEEDEDSLVAIQKLLPDMVRVLKKAVESGDEDKTLQGFTVFQTLLESDSKLLNKHFGDLVRFMINLAQDKSIDGDARGQALNWLIAAVMERKLKFQSLRIGEQVINMLMEILVEAGSSPDDQDDEFSLTMTALTMLSIMSASLPPSQVVVPLMAAFKSLSVSEDPTKRQAGITGLGACVDGAPDFIDTQLGELIPLILRLLEDPNVKVREAATSGTKNIADTLPESLGKEHQKLMSALARDLALAVQGLQGPDAVTNIQIVVNCLTAIDALVGGLKQEDISVYLQELVPHISQLFVHDDIKIKSAAIGAVGSIAECAKESFQPFFEQTMNSLGPNVQAKESEEELDLRAMTIDTMGNIAVAVGPAQFQKYVQPLMQATEEGLHLDNPRLKETSYMFWGTIAKVYGNEFKPFLEGVVKGIIACLEQEEAETEIEIGTEAADLVGQEVTIAGKKLKVVAKDEDDIEVDMDDDDEDADWSDLAAGVSPQAEEKEIALEAMAEIMVSTKGEYMPYMEQSIKIMLPMIDHEYEAVRRAAISTLFRAYATMWQLQDEDTQDWDAGLPLKKQPSQEISRLGAVLMEKTVPVWTTEEDRSVVMDINRNLAETLKLCGPAILSGENVVQNVVEVVLSIVQKKHVCQLEEFEDDEDEDLEDEFPEDDWYVIETAFDALAAIAVVLGEQFGQIWKIFEKHIIGYASSSEPIQRSAAVGTIADVTRGMEAAVTPYTVSLLAILLKRLSDEDSQTKSNAAFAVGVLVEHSTMDVEIGQILGDILSKLEPLLHTQESRQLDNAAGCVSRMILKYTEAMPLKEILPALIKLLPLKEDFEENEPVYKMIVKLYQANNPTIQGLTGQIVPVLAHVMGPPEDQLNSQTRSDVAQLVKFLHSKNPQGVQSYPSLMAALQ